MSHTLASQKNCPHTTSYRLSRVSGLLCTHCGHCVCEVMVVAKHCKWLSYTCELLCAVASSCSASTSTSNIVLVVKQGQIHNCGEWDV